MHAGVAMLRQEPHWEINDADAKRFSIAVGNVLRHSSIAVGQKYLDYLALGFVGFQIEGVRILMSAKIAEAKRKGPQPVRTAQVFQFTPPAPSGPASSVNPAPQPPPAEASPVEGFNPEYDPLGGGAETVQ